MAHADLNKILVVDLEATCWEPKFEQGDQISEIIEIGACLLDVKTGAITNKTSYLIRPTHSTLSKFCIGLTSITPELLKTDGIPFQDAVNKMSKEFGVNKTWASWGNYDQRKFREDCAFKNVPYPFKQTHINAKNLFALRKGMAREVGLAEAVRICGFEFEGQHHRGHNDAFMAAKVLWEIIKR